MKKKVLTSLALVASLLGSVSAEAARPAQSADGLGSTPADACVAIADSSRKGATIASLGREAVASRVDTGRPTGVEERAPRADEREGDLLAEASPARTIPVSVAGGQAERPMNVQACGESANEFLKALCDWYEASNVPAGRKAVPEAAPALPTVASIYRVLVESLGTVRSAAADAAVAATKQARN